MSQRETSAQIDETAADWAMRIDEAGLDEAEQARFDVWLRGDIRRVGAYARAQAVLVHAKRGKALGSGFQPASFDAAVGAAGNTTMGDDQARSAAYMRRRVLIGCGLAFAASGVAAILVPFGRAVARTYETVKGEIRVIPLEDGSTVTLNSDTRVSVRIDPAHRQVQLVRGEALFKVGSASRMPFTVEAGDASLKAESATFAICRLDRRPLRIQVCDGQIEIAPNMPAAKSRRVLHANMQAVMRPDGSISDRRITPETLERDLAWQEGMLSFEDTPLRDAAVEFARYSDRRIGIADPRVGSETVTGRYSANNPEGFARAVALGLDLHVRQTQGGILLVR